MSAGKSLQLWWPPFGPAFVVLLASAMSSPAQQAPGTVLHEASSSLPGQAQDATVEAYLQVWRVAGAGRAGSSTNPTDSAKPRETAGTIPGSLDSRQQERVCQIADQTLRDAFEPRPAHDLEMDNTVVLLAREVGPDLDAALSCGRRALQLMPRDPMVAHTLGWIYLQRNLTDQAVDTFLNLIHDGADSSSVRLHLGMAFMQSGDTASALKELNIARAETSSDPEKVKIDRLIAVIANSQ